MVRSKTDKGKKQPLTTRSYQCTRVVAGFCLAVLQRAQGFSVINTNKDVVCTKIHNAGNPTRYGVFALTAKKAPEEDDVDAVTKASWFAVEAFGKVFGSKGEKQDSSSTSSSAYSLEEPPQSLAETMSRIQEDNAREYFLSGTVDKLIYDENCVFADPFVSFEGRDRFVENLRNLGSFITKYSAKPLDYTVDDDGTAVTTKFMVKLELGLPWKPVLAWPWGVRCEIDPNTNLITLHKESWDIDAWEGVKQIFRKPTTQV